MLRRARSPIAAPAASTVAATSRLSAILSFVPKSATITSLDPGGAKSMTAVPTAIERRRGSRRQRRDQLARREGGRGRDHAGEGGCPPRGERAAGSAGRGRRDGGAGSADRRSGGRIGGRGRLGHRSLCSLPGRDRMIGIQTMPSADDGSVTRPTEQALRAATIVAASGSARRAHPRCPVPLEPRFGLFMSQASKPWTQVRDEFLMADELGFDHAWLVDHLLDTDGPPELPCLEAWTLLAALAAVTTRHPARRAGLVQHVPQPGPPRQGGRHRRPRERRPADPRGRHGLARGRASPVRLRPARAGRARGPARGGRGDPRPPPGGAPGHLRWPLLPPRRRGVRAPPGPAAADPAADRRPPAADDPPRGAVRRPVGHVPGAARVGDRRHHDVGRGADRDAR